MSTTYTPNLGLSKPAAQDRGWDSPINANTSTLDDLAPLAALFVSTAERPSASLNVQVGAGPFINQANALIPYAGVSSFAVPASATTYLWLTNAGVLTSGTAFPGAGVKVVRLAIVVAGSSTIQQITDARVAFISAG